MDCSRPRTSRPRRRPEPLIAKPRPQDSESDTLTETDSSTMTIVRPSTAFLKTVPTSSRNSSGVRGEENFLSARGSSGTETDSDTIKACPSNHAFTKFAPRRSSSGVRSVKGEEKYFSSIESTGTETETETLKPFSPKKHHSIPEPEVYTNELEPLDAEAEYSSDFESDENSGADTVIKVPPNQKYSLPVPPLNFSDVLSIESGRDYYSSTLDSDDTGTVVSALPKQKRRSSGVRSDKCLKDELPKIPILNLDDLQSVSERSSVLLKSTHGVTDLKRKDYSRRDSPGSSRLGEQLKKIDSKNMLFFPSKNLTRPSVENIYGPAKKRSPSSLRQSPNSLKSTSNISNVSSQKTKVPESPKEKEKRNVQKTPLERDTPRPDAPKEDEKPTEPTPKKNEPKILAPLLIRGRFDKKSEKIRPTGPVKPKPFMASGCGKGIPPLENLPKPKIGRVPSFILNKKRDAGDNALKSGSLNALDNIKPAIPSAAPSVAEKTDDLFTRNRIPLRKLKPTPTPSPRPGPSKTTDDLSMKKIPPLMNRGSKSTSNLIPSLASARRDPFEVRPKKSVTFDLPDPPQSPEHEEQVEDEQVEEQEAPKAPYSTYKDPCRQKFKKFFARLPTFEDGPLPDTEPSPLYQIIKAKGWDYSKFTPKNVVLPVATIPYNFLDQYLHIFDNKLERAAVHMRYGNCTDCTCDQIGDGAEYCEKHIDAPKLQYYREVAEVMIGVLAYKYEVPEYEDAEKLFQEIYPSIYNGWIVKKPNRLSWDYRVRETKCKAELVQACQRVLIEEQLFAEFSQSEEIIGEKRDIYISGAMRDVDDDFESSYAFLFMEYPHLFIQLVEKIEFMPLSMERKAIGLRRQLIAERATWPDEKLQKLEEYLSAKLSAKQQQQEQ